MFEAVKCIISREAGFRAYRTKLKQTPFPKVPYIGLYLTDATFIEDGNPRLIENLINFQKFRLMALGVAKTIGEYQKIKYNFTPIPELQDCIKKGSTMTEDDMYKKSLEIEERRQKKNVIK